MVVWSESKMAIHSVEDVYMAPGESAHYVVKLGSDNDIKVAFFVRPMEAVAPHLVRTNLDHRAGLIKFNDVLLVLTMLRIPENHNEIFDVWWNYHSDSGRVEFEMLAAQESLPIFLCLNNGEKEFIEIDNAFQKFFSQLAQVMERTEPWTDVAFERAVRGFCAQSYPRDQLWEAMELREEEKDLPPTDKRDLEHYQGIIPDELRAYYTYVADQGHCIRIIPSMLEENAKTGNPDEYLHAAPVKTVLRCGIRWIKGFPVAPIPYIPGHGLAVPPDDIEL